MLTSSHDGSDNERKTADERREAVLEAALTEFAEHGYSGASTDVIARAAGISQPYLFRLFGTKRELFIASVERCLGARTSSFRAASEGLSGEEALAAIGQAYGEMIAERPAPAPRADAGLRGLRRRRDRARSCSAASAGSSSWSRRRAWRRERVTVFFAYGMLINVMASMGLLDSTEPWAKRADGELHKGRLSRVFLSVRE